MDIYMPEVDGFVATNEIKLLCQNMETIYGSSPAFDIKIIVVTAFNDYATQTNAINVGADAFLQKPIHLPDLVRIFESLHL